jgi:hypothetical protein
MIMGDDAELGELRRRAYGPDADIDADPIALARLRDLEERRRASGTVDVGPVAASLSSAPTLQSRDAEEASSDGPHRSESEPAVRLDSHLDAEDLEESSAASVTSRARGVSENIVGTRHEARKSPEATRGRAGGSAPRHRRMRHVILVGAASFLAFGAGIVSSFLGQDRPDLVLRPESSAGTQETRKGDDPFPADAGTPIAFEGVGSLDVTVLRMAETVCLALQHGELEPVSACDATEGFRLSMDIVVSAEGGVVATTGLESSGAARPAFSESVTGYPDGTRIRFVLREDRVEVWTTPPEEEP